VPRSTVVIELARDATLSRDLAAGGVFVRGCALRISEECDLVVCGANRRVSVPARVVYVDEHRGAGLELIGFSTAMREQLAELAVAEPAARPALPLDDDLALPTDCHIELSGDDDDLAVPVATDSEDDRRTMPVRTPLPLPLPAPPRATPPPRAAPPPRPPPPPRAAPPAHPALVARTPAPRTPAPRTPAPRVMAASTPAPQRAPVAAGTDDRLAVPVWQDDDEGRSTVPVAVNGRAAAAEALEIDDSFAAGDAAAGAGDDFDFADDPVAVVTGDAAAEHDDFAADDSDAAGFFDPDDPAPMRAGDAAALHNDFFDGNGAGIDRGIDARIDPRIDGAIDAAMFAGDAAGVGHDFADGALGEGEPVPMQAGDAAAAMGNDFADDEAGESPITEAPGAPPGRAPDAEPDAEPDPGDPANRLAAGTRGPRNVQERLRGLNLAGQIKLATNGELHERIVLERLYGKNVWETLLRNPRLTAPEVSRIARYGSLPRVLLELILANNAWLQVPEVRRALLANPRLGTDHIMKVLRLTPKHELRLAAVQTAYPHAVRNAAKQLLRE
jgi:hypothetical protein